MLGILSLYLVFELVYISHSTSQLGLATFQELSSHMGSGTTLDRTIQAIPQCPICGYRGRWAPSKVMMRRMPLGHPSLIYPARGADQISWKRGEAKRSPIC